LRELALREVVHARGDKRTPPFPRFAVGVKSRGRDVALIERGARIAQRLQIEFTVVNVVGPNESASTRVTDALAEAAHRVRARWRTVVAKDAAAGLVAVAREEGAPTIVVEGARNKPFWPRGVPF